MPRLRLADLLYILAIGPILWGSLCVLWKDHQTREIVVVDADGEVVTPSTPR